MKPQPESKPDEPTMSESEIQQGGTRSISTEDALERAVKQHPQRDEPKVDSVEQDELPPP
ncbi:hypothetical protein JJB11_12450 [Ramlibacter ginsenosidimutans]|uniref:Uncharacterized protein n=1 Tax=Ramlibacter ginsenosidimutans TaxID=502333 RepID=A0A934WMW2_9BURK|nr:hypothetical protein [Ramlibacter ginsenosidimutans]MBK6006903.1 hypothetical protein [Ramlibacter ginsenosidimutans]